MNVNRAILLAATLLLVPAISSHASGDPPELMSYQGYLVDANGVPLGTDGAGNSLPANYDVQFRIFAAPSGGSALWAEEQTITIDNGYFSVLLGEGTAVSGISAVPLSSVFTGSNAAERYIGISVRFETSGDFSEILPRLRLLSSPYAFAASQARSLVNPDGQKVLTVDAGDVTIAGTLRTTQPITVPSISGSGANLTSLDANQISQGTLNTARLPATVVRRDVSNTFTAGQAFNANNTFWGLNNFYNPIGMNDHAIRLRGTGDGNHGLAWFGPGRTFTGGYSPDGPVLWGNLGGGLATANGTRALTWDYSGNVNMNVINFGIVRRQHLNLWGTQFGIGVQDSTLYFRTDNTFAWHRQGSHSNSFADPGGGLRVMQLDYWGTLTTSGNVSAATLVVPRTAGDVNSWSGIRFQHPNGLYGFIEYHTGNSSTPVRGGGRRLVLGASGWSNQQGNGTNFASYDGDSNWDFGSDVRIKRDIVDAEAMLDRVMDVRLRRFRYKDQAEEDEKLHLGVIAQELISLFPGMVSEGFPMDDGDPMLMVGYSDFGMIAIKAIQEMQVQQRAVEAELRAENAELRGALAELQAAVAQLLAAQSAAQ